MNKEELFLNPELEEEMRSIKVNILRDLHIQVLLMNILTHNPKQLGRLEHL